MPGDRRLEPSGLQVLFRLIRRRALLIAIPLVLVPAAALIFSLEQEKEYTAAASIIFRDSGSGAPPLASENPEREAATNVRLLRQPAVEQRVERALGGPIDGTVDVVAEGDSNLVTVEATATDPRRAARIANTYVRQYAAWRRSTTRQELRDEQRRLRQELEAARGDRRRKFEREALREQLAELAVTLPTAGSIRRVGSAEPPTAATSPNPARNTLIGALVGLILGLALAVARERLDRRIRDPQELESAFERPIIGRIPKSRALAKRRPSRKGLPPAETEAFHALRANLLYFAGDGGRRSVLVTSAEPGEGKTTVAWNLACAASSPATRVVLIEGDLRRPTLARSFGGQDEPGLTEYLQGDASLDDVVREVAVPSSEQRGGMPRTVELILAGSSPANPLDLLDSERMRELLADLSESYDLVVIDTPPTSAAADAIPLITQVGGVIVVGRLARSTYESAVELRELLERLDAPTLGVVVNSDEPRPDYYGARAA